MIQRIVQSERGVTLIGGGETGPADLALALNRAPILVAADGGAATALRDGRKPVAVIGDMDSLSASDAARLDAATLHQIDDQETTDFEKCLARIEAPLILCVGFFGGRIDHQLAVLGAVVRAASQRCILIGARDVCFHCPPDLRLSLVPGARLSLFPMARCRGTATGLRWPIDGIDFAPDGRIGTSNVALGGAVTLAMHGPGMLVMLERDCLDEAIRALASAGSHGG